MSATKTLRATGAMEKIVKELTQFRDLYSEKTTFLSCDNDGVMTAFSVFQTPARDTTDILTYVCDFFKTEAETRCVVSDNMSAFVNMSTPDILLYYMNLQIVFSALDFPFVFLREYTQNQPVNPSICDDVRRKLAAFLNAYSVLMASLTLLLSRFSFHVLSNVDTLWEATILDSFHEILERISTEAVVLCDAFTGVSIHLQDLP